MPGEPAPTFRPAVVAPTFNNGRTLPDVLAQLETLHLPIIVVNDGATDATADFLKAWTAFESPDRIVVTFAANRGKAAALQAGFEMARSREFTHALTIDTDGQHDVADVAAILPLASANPSAMILGQRPIESDYPLGSRIGRRLSNGFIRIESGLAVSDSQCGLRIYPLAPIARLRPTANRYGFETEILTRCAWAGIAVIEHPIRCIYTLDHGRISHFRPVVDSLRAMLMHTKLLVISFAPSRPTHHITGTIFQRLVRWLSPLKMWRDVRAGRNDGRFPTSVGVGMFMAVVPLYGVKTIACMILAKLFRLQPLVVLAVSSLNTPPTGPVLAALSIATGYTLLHGSAPGLSQFNPARDGWWPTFQSVATEWILGGLIVGAILAITAYWIARASVHLAAKEKQSAFS